MSLTLASYLALCFSSVSNAQFKEIGPPPFSATVAHQRIAALLDQVDSTNRQQTLDKLNSWTPWFRSVLDEELIAGWRRESRQRLTLVIEPLADTRVAAAVVEFSWRTRTEGTLNPSYASMLGHLMARYPESGTVFLSDLLGPMPPELSPPAIETVCRILLDMPDLGAWHENALRILPRYRATAERLLTQDRQEGDQEKGYRAQAWLAELRGETPGAIHQVNEPPVIRRRGAGPPLERSSGPLFYPSSSGASASRAPDQRPEATAGNRPGQPSPAPAPSSTPPQALPGTVSGSAPTTTNVPPPPQTAPVPASYNGPASGTLECTGNPVPQNAEYVFRNLPAAKLQLEYDQKIWEARLAGGENQTQRLILKNRSSGPQKRCVVHWSIVP